MLSSRILARACMPGRGLRDQQKTASCCAAGCPHCPHTARNASRYRHARHLLGLSLSEPASRYAGICTVTRRCGATQSSTDTLRAAAMDASGARPAGMRGSYADGRSYEGPLSSRMLAPFVSEEDAMIFMCVQVQYALSFHVSGQSCAVWMSSTSNTNQGRT